MMLAHTRNRKATRPMVLTRGGADYPWIFDEGAWPYIRTYSRNVRDYTEMLYNDVMEQIVHDDPAELEKAASAAEKYYRPDLAAQFRATAKNMRKRIATRGAAQASKDLNFTSRFRPFRREAIEWDELMHQIASWDRPAPKESWNRTQNLETRLKQFEAEFKTLGGTKPSFTTPKSLATPTGEPSKDPTEIPWTGILIVGGLIAAASIIRALT